jgi:hypothetical protein
MNMATAVGLTQNNKTMIRNLHVTQLYIYMNCNFCVPGAAPGHTDEVLSLCKKRKILMTEQHLKVKCTLVQALRLCKGRTAQRRNRGIVLPLQDHGNRRG